MENKNARGLKITAIVFMGLNTGMNILGGTGTVCAAFIPLYVMVLGTKDYQWLYQTLMITTILIGIAGVWSTVKLIKGGKDLFKWALIILIIGTVLSGTQFFASLSIRGAATPANVKFLSNAVTLLLFLILRYTKLGAGVDFSNPSSKADNKMAGGLAAFTSGLAVLSVFIWAGPSHTYMGESWIDIYGQPILFTGAVLVGAGLVSIIWSFFQMANENITEISPKSTM